MQVTAKLRYLRLAPRKVRQVADAIRGKKVTEAQTILQFLVRRPVLPISKLLKSAIASARNDFQLEEKNLYISKITVDEGPKLKRWMPVSRGRANQIFKRTSHITLILDEIKPTPKKKKKSKKTAIPKIPMAKPSRTLDKIGAGEKKEETIEKEVKEEDIIKEKFKPKKKEIKKPVKRFGALKKIFRRKAM